MSKLVRACRRAVAATSVRVAKAGRTTTHDAMEVIEVFVKSNLGSFVAYPGGCVELESTSQAPMKPGGTVICLEWEELRIGSRVAP